MGALVMAWLVGEGIIIYRSVKNQHVPPGPGQLALSSGVFVLLALLAEAEGARPLAVALAWGFDGAAFMNLWGTGGPKSGEKPKGWPPARLPDNVILTGIAGPGTSGKTTTV